jgi:hypothetical protein
MPPDAALFIDGTFEFGKKQFIYCEFPGERIVTDKLLQVDHGVIFFVNKILANIDPYETIIPVSIQPGRQRLFRSREVLARQLHPFTGNILQLIRQNKAVSFNLYYI